ncbi:DUF1499 domain-containing protein [Psychromonas ossibalaenae]|uniref:DUF1499 domain-containing protein n=1 Tax=Psychromonas ossibalaenae TaxID=444922 RepID=UPI0003672857|nr:DUF1499 domain-containing protein [Psychromonas ossibalaenae]
MKTHRLLTALTAAFAIVALGACSDKLPADSGLSGSSFTACPASPNCVSSDSDAGDSEHFIAPLRFESSPEKAWSAVREEMQVLARTTIIAEKKNYLHFEVRSAFWGFVDDVKLQLRPNEGIIAVFSASRSGYYDFAVNRKRIENIRNKLLKRGVITCTGC